MGRARSSSIVKVESVGHDSQEQDLDQGVYDNVNAEWVNGKGELCDARRSSGAGLTMLRPSPAPLP